MPSGLSAFDPLQEVVEYGTSRSSGTPRFLLDPGLHVPLQFLALRFDGKHLMISVLGGFPTVGKVSIHFDVAFMFLHEELAG
jgi:hypothetical protein